METIKCVGNAAPHHHTAVLMLENINVLTNYPTISKCPVYYLTLMVNMRSWGGEMMISAYNFVIALSLFYNN